MMDFKLYRNFPINDYENQVYYQDREKRDEIFDTFKAKTFENLSSCDKTKQTIRLDIEYYQGNTYNYGCIIEYDKSVTKDTPKKEKKEKISKIYYVFLEVVEWLSNHTVVLHYTYDYWQTYCHTVKFEKSYIEREHVRDDSFGAHLLDESLPISEYKIQNKVDVHYNQNNVLFCVVLSDNRYIYDDSQHHHRSKLYYPNGSGVAMLTIGFDDEHFEDAVKLIDYYVDHAKIDSIQGFYYACVGGAYRYDCYVYNDETGVEEDIEGYIVHPNTAYSTDHVITRGTSTIDGYKPNNNKCYCYPYNFVNVTNYLGSSIKAKFELANDKNTIRLAVNFPTTEGASPTCFLKNYDGLEDALDFNMSSFVNPELPYVTNQYSAYLSANVNSINNTQNYIESDRNWAVTNAMVQMGTGVVAGAMTGGVAGGIAVGSSMMSGGMSIGNANYQMEKAFDSINASLSDMQNKGDIQHGAFISSTLTNLNRVGFQMQHLTVTKDCIETIDHYFSMFGYRVNHIDYPRLHTRKRWNFLKTCGVNIVGNVPQDALTVIKNMFNNGTTIWHNINTMYDYDFDDNGVI